MRILVNVLVTIIQSWIFLEHHFFHIIRNWKVYNKNIGRFQFSNVLFQLWFLLFGIYFEFVFHNFCSDATS